MQPFSLLTEYHWQSHFRISSSLDSPCHGVRCVTVEVKNSSIPGEAKDKLNFTLYVTEREKERGREDLIQQFLVSEILVLVALFLEIKKKVVLRGSNEGKYAVYLQYSGQRRRTFLRVQDKMSRHDKWLFIGLWFGLWDGEGYKWRDKTEVR